MARSRLHLTLPVLLLLIGCTPRASQSSPAPSASVTLAANVEDFTPQPLPTIIRTSDASTTLQAPTPESPATQPQPTRTPTPAASKSTTPSDMIDPQAFPASDPISPGNAHALIRLGQIPGSINFSPDMRHAAWNVDEKIKIISLEEARTIAELPEYSMVSFSPDGSRVAWETGTGPVTVRDLVQPIPDIVLENISPECCTSLTFSPDPRFLLVSDQQPSDDLGLERVLRLWDIDRQDAPVTWTAYDWGQFSPTGAQIGFKRAVGVGASLWDVDSLEEIGSVAGFEVSGPEFGLLFSPDWNSAAFWSRSAGEVYSLSTGGIRFPFNGQARRFSPDGALLATAEVGWVLGECSSAVCLYDAYSGMLRTVLAHKDSVRHMEFSPDGGLLATVAGGGLYLWDIAARSEIEGVRSEALAVERVGFTPNGRYLLAYGFARDGSGDIVEFWAVALDA